MANKAFAGTMEQSSDDLQGRLAADLPWTKQEDSTETPWNETLEHGEARIGVPMKLQASDDGERTFIVNAAPILGEDGKSRGVLASFDDVTDLETKKTELLKILRALKTSREEIQEQNVQLKRLATIDPLTECLNRRSFFPQFDVEWKKARTTICRSPALWLTSTTSSRSMIITDMLRAMKF